MNSLATPNHRSDHDPRRVRKPQAKAHLWQPAFLAVLAATCNVRTACLAAGIDRSTATKARGRNPDFARRWEEAIEEAIDDLLAAAWRLARAGRSERVLVALLRIYGPYRPAALIEAVVRVRRLARQYDIDPLDEARMVEATLRLLRGRRGFGRRLC